MPSIMQKITSLLAEQGKKQKDLADYIGVSENRITDWKSGRIKSYMKYLPKIADFLDVTVDYLLGKEELPSPATKENYVTLHCRGGETIESELSDKQIELIKFIIKQKEDDA